MDIGSDGLAIVAIRRESAGRHTTLEGVLQLTPSLSRRRYLDALRGFELFLSVWEPRIDLALPVSLRHWFASRSRRGLLQLDLDRLDQGRTTSDGARRGCERAVSEIELASVAATFGSLYVMEGSVLGGKVLARAARSVLGLDAHNGAAYFNGSELHPGASWTAFQVLLEDQVGPEPASRRQACQAARQTFDALITTFTGPSRAAPAA